MRAATEIRVAEQGRILAVTFDDGSRHTLPAEYLRVESPSAEVQGHAPHQKQIVPGRRHVCIIGVEPVGHYAIRLIFDDLHESGIYTWDYLDELGRDYGSKWSAYLANLTQRGLRRDP